MNGAITIMYCRAHLKISLIQKLMYSLSYSSFLISVLPLVIVGAWLGPTHDYYLSEETKEMGTRAA